MTKPIPWLAEYPLLDHVPPKLTGMFITVSSSPALIPSSVIASFLASLLFFSNTTWTTSLELEARHPHDCARYLCSRKKACSIFHKTWKHLICQFPFHWQHKPLCDSNLFPAQFWGHCLRDYDHRWPEIPTDHNHHK